MTPLLRVTKALKTAYDFLPDKDKIDDLLYLLDVDHYGAESLMVLIAIRAKTPIEPKRKLEIEAAIRQELAKACDYQAYFRWRTDEEGGWDKPSVTKAGLLDHPVSVVKGREKPSAGTSAAKKTSS